MRRITPKEALRRRRILVEKYENDRPRAVEDDIEDLHPERNIYKRQGRELFRRFEDFKEEEQNVGEMRPTERRDKLAAIVKQGRRNINDVQATGTRNFVNSGIRSNSADDFALQNRMTGFFGPKSGGEAELRKHDSQTMDELLAEFKQLREELAIKAIELQ